jgi:CHAP domain|nr:MAG TPA: Endolysin [Caudoviricetes sp.]
MTLEQFVEKYNGKKIDYDGHYGAQCVDVFRQYCKDVLAIPHTGGVVGAAELYTKYDTIPLEQKYFERIPYKASMQPEKGDVVIFAATKANQYGHIAIVLNSSAAEMVVFEQDGFKQDGAHVSSWSYARVLGFLRKR